MKKKKKDQEHKEIEKKLAEYYKKDRKISILNNRIDTLLEQIDNINNKLKNNNFIYIADGFKQDREEKEKEVLELQQRVNKIELDNCLISNNIVMFTEEIQTILEYRYKKNWSTIKIARELFCSQTYVNNKLRYIREDLIRWQRWGKGAFENESN